MFEIRSELSSRTTSARTIHGSRAVAGIVSSFALFGFALVACTLTGDDLAPRQVVTEVETQRPEDAMRDAGSPGDDADVADPGEVICATSEIGGCNLGLQGSSACEMDAECASRRCVQGTCLPATCGDGSRNQGETDVDCGGACGATCALGQGCEGAADCQGGLACVASECSPPASSCSDGERNGNEADVDCGGDCGGCGEGATCSSDADCQSGFCSGAGVCAPPSCEDGRRNQDESDVDCGGSCDSRCSVGEQCESADDCQSGVCAAAGCGGSGSCCQPPRCDDGVRNGEEPQTDCGNATCGLCALGGPCGRDAHCASDNCSTDGVCVLPACEDGERGGNESDIDCGGNDPDCRRCNAGESCNGGDDCASGICLGGVCANCGDGIQNGTETDVDCGGSCGGCAPGRACAADADCQSDACEDGRCCGGFERDCTRCAERLSARVNDLTCDDAGDPNAASTCRAFLDCLAANEVCTIRYSVGCTDNPGGACNSASFGGDFSPGVALADSILGNASCFF